MAISFNADSRLLFIGDSITDCDRAADPEGLGNGYVRLIRDYLIVRDPQTAPHVINMGVGGNRIADMVARWQRDVIQQAPHILSIQIGINDVWHSLTGGQGSSPAQYEQMLRDLIVQTRETLPHAQIVLCDPTVIGPPAPEEGNARLQPYITAVHKLAEKYRTFPPIPLHTGFKLTSHYRPDVPLTTDGVHPNSTGHLLIARTWLKTLGLLESPSEA